MSEETVANYFPEEGYKGAGFFLVDTYPSPDSSILAVEGCYLASNFEIVFFDFTEPDNLPYKEIRRICNILDVRGWNDNGIFVVEQEIEIRKSDGVPYDELTEEEQDALDDGEEEASYRIDTLKIDINELLNRR